DQIIAWIGEARCAPISVCVECTPSLRYGRASHVQFGKIGAAGELFDSAAKEIARREIHVLEGASSLEDGVNQADTLEQLRPVDVGDEAHAGDDVTHREAAGDLPLMFVENDSVGGPPLPG